MIERAEFLNVAHAEASTRINYSPDYCKVAGFNQQGVWATCTNQPMRGSDTCVGHLIEFELDEMEYLAQKDDQTEGDCVKFAFCQIELERLRKIAEARR